MKDRFKIVLLSASHFDSVYHYTTDTLPLLGDTIELEKGRTFFKITETFMLPAIEGDCTAGYILCGKFLGKQLSASNFKDLKHRIYRIANLDIELNSYGNVIFPESLD